MGMLGNIFFYGVIIVGLLLVGGLTYYRIDWMRHPEKYQKDVEQYDKEMERKRQAAQQAAVEKVKAQKSGKKTSEPKPRTFMELLDKKLKDRHR